MKTKTEISINDTPNYLNKANKLLENPEPTSKEIELHMKRLFMLRNITPEVIETYKKLEKTWKLLTGFKINETHVI